MPPSRLGRLIHEKRESESNHHFAVTLRFERTERRKIRGMESDLTTRSETVADR